MKRQPTRFAIVYYSSIEPRPNRALWQRSNVLGSRYQAALLTKRKSIVDKRLLDGGLQVFRMPISLPVFGTRPMRCILRLFDLSTFSVQCLTTLVYLRLRLGVKVVYTFQSIESVIGRLSQLLRFSWVLDVLDLPSYFADAARSHRALGNYGIAFLQEIFSRLLGRNADRANLVITTALSKESGFARQLRDDYGVRKERLIAVPNGADTTLCAASPLFYHKVLRLLYVGIASPCRGTEILLEACWKLKKRGLEFELTLAGPSADYYREPLALGIEAKGLGDVVKVLGPVPHDTVRKLLQEATICLYPFQHLPSFEDVLPIKLFEYLASAKLVVASDLNAVKAIIRNGQNGYIAKADDAGEWAEAILRAACQREKWESMSKAARETGLRYDWKGINQVLVRELEASLWGTCSSDLPN